MTIDLKLGDCLALMREMPDASVDAIVTDPPYGTKKAHWDHSVDRVVFAECLRLSRGYCLFFYSNTRLWHMSPINSIIRPPNRSRLWNGLLRRRQG